jgi:homoaconitase/3-isopropylmalate dehydratase large subunit
MEPDDKTLAYLEGRARAEFEPVRSDPDAEIEQHLQYDISDLPPQIACPHAVDNVCSVEKVAGKKIDPVVFGSCTNARLEDFAIVAKVLDGKKIHPSTRLIVIPASSQVLEQALQSGYIDILVRAGATLVNSGCGPCMGNHEGVLAPQEVTLSTSNRNFKGRFGCKDAEIYLCSPLTAAVSALTGEITDFRSFTL